MTKNELLLVTLEKAILIRKDEMRKNLNFCNDKIEHYKSKNVNHPKGIYWEGVRKVVDEELMFYDYLLDKFERKEGNNG